MNTDAKKKTLTKYQGIDSSNKKNNTLPLSEVYHKNARLF